MPRKKSAPPIEIKFTFWLDENEALHVKYEGSDKRTHLCATAVVEAIALMEEREVVPISTPCRACKN